ncbi:MAG: hypothetical protein IJ728_02485 [Selenomonadaceae bacterium]|nr:hypothetical protein [Selenomonadaceae bacterium]
MLNELIIVKADTLPVEQRNYNDAQIVQLIQQHKNNRGEINRMTIECATSLAAGQSRSAALSSQGFFSRLFGSLTGKNQRLQAEIYRNFAAALRITKMSSNVG